MNETEAQEWIVKRIEPLAQSMTTLAQNTSRVLNQVQDRIESQAGQWEEQQKTIAKEWIDQQRTMALQHQEAVARLDRITRAAAETAMSLKWRVRTYIVAGAIAVFIGATAPVAYLHWQHRYSKKAETRAFEAENWRTLLDNRDKLTPDQKKTVDNLLKIRRGD